jgi:hypothetical protein
MYGGFRGISVVNLRIVIKQVRNAVVAVQRERADEVELVPPAAAVNGSPAAVRRGGSCTLPSKIRLGRAGAHEGLPYVNWSAGSCRRYCAKGVAIDLGGLEGFQNGIIHVRYVERVISRHGRRRGG